MPLPTLREVQTRVGEAFRGRGGVGAILINLVPLERVERGFGGATYQSVRSQVESLMAEIQEEVQGGDVLAWDERHPDSFLLFLLGPGEAPSEPFRIDRLRSLAERIDEQLTPRVARLTQPYIKDKPALEIGYGFVLHSPYESEERQIVRLIEDARRTAQLRRRLRDRQDRERLLEVIHNQDVWTVFQPILEIESRDVLGHEALSRGPRGTPLEAPLRLFGLAAEHGLTEELERSCRRQGFRDWELFGGRTRLFINTVPATVRDTSFIGRGVLDYLGPTLAPSAVTLEITERQIIENLALFREAMHGFLELGFSFAIDDVGAGYSGLETISRLGVSYLKVDLSLVRGIHEKRVNQQIIKAILELSQGVGASVIAEGIESEDEARALIDLGVRYGQGYLYGRPHDPRARRPVVLAQVDSAR